VVRVADDEQLSAWLLVQATRRTLERLELRRTPHQAPAHNGPSPQGGDLDAERDGEQSIHDEHIYVLGQLAGTIAHDFNNLLTIIHGYCHLARRTLREKGDLRTVGFYLEKIADKTTRGGELVDRIMRYSHKQSGQLVNVPINDFLVEMNDMLRQVVGEGIELRINLNREAGAIQIDPKSLEQVLMNLVDNASDAMHGHGRLEIATAPVELDEFEAATRAVPTGAYIALIISDTGCGMPPETLERIFDPYFTTKELGVGTGLGLASVYSNVRRHGGHIHVESEVGRGTTFEILWPEAGDSAASAPGPHP
jgi:two-component system, cell cycle sensor histidine kinase and response regulator CckA